MTVEDVAAGKGTWVMLDLPIPLEPVIVDTERPLEEQISSPLYLEASKKMLAEFLAK